MQTARDIITYIGRAKLAGSLGIGRDAVDAAYRKNKLPSLWYDAVEHLAGRPLPRSAFSFKAIKPGVPK